MPASVQWYRADTYDVSKKDRVEVVKGDRMSFANYTKTEKAYLYITKAKIEDSGVYYCFINNQWGPGTEVKVVSKWLKMFHGQ